MVSTKQPLKASAPTLVNVSGSVTEPSRGHAANTPDAIEVTPCGMTVEVMSAGLLRMRVS